jgi:CMP-N,N'-diacetyllegionaminic acid synthase
LKILGLIPARAGSERLPGKNLIDLGGKPLIRWTIDEAKKFRLFDHLVVTTDDHQVAAVAGEAGCEVIVRPEELARSETPMLPVVLHAVSAFKSDMIILLQPTSPFRTIGDIEACYDLMISTHGDSVVSVTDAPEDIVFELGHANRMRPSTKLVVPNGAIYIVTADELERRGNWYSGVSYAYRMPKERSLDIDSKWDLEIARHMIGQWKVRVA